MAKTRLIYWIDVGMAVMAGVFIAIVIFLRGEGYYIPVLYGFGAVVMVWAFVAESAAVSAERKQSVPASDTGMQRTTHTKLLPH